MFGLNELLDPNYVRRLPLETKASQVIGFEYSYNRNPRSDTTQLPKMKPEIKMRKAIRFIGNSQNGKSLSASPPKTKTRSEMEA
jgi:hypothetical protein